MLPQRLLKMTKGAALSVQTGVRRFRQGLGSGIQCAADVPRTLKKTRSHRRMRRACLAFQHGAVSFPSLKGRIWLLATLAPQPPAMLAKWPRATTLHRSGAVPSRSTWGSVSPEPASVRTSATVPRQTHSRTAQAAVVARPRFGMPTTRTTPSPSGARVSLPGFVATSADPSRRCASARSGVPPSQSTRKL